MLTGPERTPGSEPVRCLSQGGVDSPHDDTDWRWCRSPRRRPSDRPGGQRHRERDRGCGRRHHSVLRCGRCTRRDHRGSASQDGVGVSAETTIERAGSDDQASERTRPSTMDTLQAFASVRADTTVLAVMSRFDTYTTLSRVPMVDVRLGTHVLCLLRRRAPLSPPGASRTVGRSWHMSSSKPQERSDCLGLEQPIGPFGPGARKRLSRSLSAGYQHRRRMTRALV